MTVRPAQPIHSLFSITETLSVAPGSSPFHVRGVFYDRVLKSAATSPGGVDALIREIRDPRARTFAGQQFRWSEWYDAAPMVPIQVALCRLQGGDFGHLVQRRARAAAEALVPRVFQMLLGLGSPKAAAEHLPRLLAYYFDFGRIELEVDTTHGRGVLTHIPRIVAPGFVYTVLGLVEGALQLMGAKLVSGSYSDVALGSPVHGFETIRCEMTFRWVK